MDFNKYFNQINNKTFRPVTRSIFDTIESEGLTEEYNSDNMSDWTFCELSLNEEDKNGLINFEPNIVQKFNEFDISLKKYFSMEYIDLIDYDHGKVYIVKSKNKYIYN